MGLRRTAEALGAASNQGGEAPRGCEQGGGPPRGAVSDWVVAWRSAAAWVVIFGSGEQSLLREALIP